VLSERQHERELALIDVDSSTEGIDRDPEQRAVGSVHDESERAPPAAQKQHVRVVAAEEPLIEWLLQPPDGRRE
jgi:hypothetical protein